MGRFHFETEMGNKVAASLSEINNSLQKVIKSIDNEVKQLESYSGFNINEIVNGLRLEISLSDMLGLKAESRAEVLRAVINSANNHAKTASAIVKAAVGAGAEAINNVIDSSASAETEQRVITFGTALHGEIFESGGYTYKNYNWWNQDRLLRTDSAGGIGLFKSDGSTFEAYNQHYQQFTHGEWAGQECTSTALAQSSTINGVYKQANDYNDWGGNTQIGAYKTSSENVTKYCVDNLKNGYSTVIYYNYSGFDGFGHDGHAVTVVGADPNPTSIYDLWVIDPADGLCKSFKDACGSKSNNFYICYESNPNQFGGAGIKKWDIEQYFGITI